MAEKWVVGEPGGPAGPFWSVVSSTGRVIAMQIPEKEVAERIAKLPELEAIARVLQERLEPRLYSSEAEQKELRLSELAGRITYGLASEEEREEHDRLMQELAKEVPWIGFLAVLRGS